MANRVAANSADPRQQPRSLIFLDSFSILLLRPDRKIVTHVCDAVHRDRITVSLFFLRFVPSPSSFSFTVPTESFLLFHFGRPQSSMGEDYTSLSTASQPNRPFSSRNPPEPSYAPREFAYLARLNLKTARNARAARLDRG